MATYWDYVENGRGPGKQPPVWKIYEWIQAKGITPKNDLPGVESLSYAIQRSMKKKNGWAPPRVALLEWIKKKDIRPKFDPVMSLAWAISKSIARDGTDPHPFFEEAKADAIARYEEPIVMAIREDIETFIENQISDLGKIF